MRPVINSSPLIGGKFILKKSPLQDLLSSLADVIATNSGNYKIRFHKGFDPIKDILTS